MGNKITVFVQGIAFVVKIIEMLHRTYHLYPRQKLVTSIGKGFLCTFAATSYRITNGGSVLEAIGNFMKYFGLGEQVNIAEQSGAFRFAEYKKLQQ